MQKRTIITLALALVALAAIVVSSSGALAADAPDTEIRYYRMTIFTGADANGTTVKVLAPQQDMSYPRNCTLYMVVSNYDGAGILEVRAAGQVLGTVSPRDMTMITFTTPTGNATTYPLEFMLDGKRLLAITYQLTSVRFEVYSETNMMSLEEMRQEWQDRLNRERSLRERNETVIVEQDYLDQLEAAQTPIMISAALSLIGIFAAFAVKWGCREMDVVNGINVIFLITAAVVLGAVDLYSHVLQGNLLFYIPFVVAYLTTYWLYKLPETKTARLDIANHRLHIGRRVHYEDADDGQWCEALQDWRKVLARWVRGDRCIVTANGSLVPDWTLVDEDSGEESPLLIINYERTTDAPTKPAEEMTWREKIMGVPGSTRKELNLAKGGQFSHVDYLVNPEAWTGIMSENQRLFQGIHRIMSSLPTLSRSLAEEIIEYIQGYEAEEPTKRFRTFIIRLIQRNPTALLDGRIWERYQAAKAAGTLGKRGDNPGLIAEIDNEVAKQDKLIPQADLRNPDRSAGHMGTSPGKEG